MALLNAARRVEAWRVASAGVIEEKKGWAMEGRGLEMSARRSARGGYSGGSVREGILFVCWVLCVATGSIRLLGHWQVILLYSLDGILPR